MDALFSKFLMVNRLFYFDLDPYIAFARSTEFSQFYETVFKLSLIQTKTNTNCFQKTMCTIMMIRSQYCILELAVIGRSHRGAFALKPVLTGSNRNRNIRKYLPSYVLDVLLFYAGAWPSYLTDLLSQKLVLKR